MVKVLKEKICNMFKTWWKGGRQRSADSYLDCQVFQELHDSLQDRHHQVNHAGLWWHLALPSARLHRVDQVDLGNLCLHVLPRNLLPVHMNQLYCIYDWLWPYAHNKAIDNDFKYDEYVWCYTVIVNRTDGLTGGPRLPGKPFKPFRPGTPCAPSSPFLPGSPRSPGYPA